MKISSTDKTMHQVLGHGFFTVPRFQRPYSWDRNNVDDFWNDIVSAEEQEYFIGSMVVFRGKDGTYGVVDGQQRLTTITMVLAALRNAYESVNDTQLAKGVQTLIEKPDVDAKLRFVLETETSFPYFQEHIQKVGVPDFECEVGREEQNLKTAFTALSEHVSDVIEIVQKDARIEESKKGAAITTRLSGIRDRILALKLIFIDVDNEDDAYSIFETLNTRGKDLAVSDLVKNHFTRLLKPANKGVDIARVKWDKTREIIEGASVELKIDTFLHHYWLSKYEFLTIKQLFKSFRKKVTQSSARKYLEELLDDAKTYRQIHETAFKKWTQQERPIREALDALGLFGVTQQTPMVLSIMREYNAGHLKPRHAGRALKAVEKFHLMFTQLTAQRSSGGISAMYSASARKLASAQDEQERLQAVQDLIDKLVQRLPTEAEFVIGFSQLLYSDKYAKHKKVVRYLLGSFYANQNPSHVPDLSQMTIEHLYPQSGEDDLDEEHARCVAEMGNLILVPQSLNSQLANKSFAQKKAILLRANVALDKWVSRAETWGPEEIGNRTKWMSEVAYRKIWKIE